jgi:hypothetical protein
MQYLPLNRHRLIMKPLAKRRNKRLVGRDFISPDQVPTRLSAADHRLIADCARRVISARRKGRPVMMAFGAHTIKNGLAPVLIKLMESGWLTHLATNGAGIIHDWEFAFQGRSSEDVRHYVARGEFGNWQETGLYINLALNIGSYEGKGYGAAVGACIQSERLQIPASRTLEKAVIRDLKSNPERAAVAAELLSVVKRFRLRPGELRIPHPWKHISVQAAAWRLGIPLTGHPMIGHDIIYNHPMNNGALLGRAALRDFLAFAGAVRQISGGVYLSVGSAVMSPMIFEKAMSMAQNLARQAGKRISGHTIFVVDLAPANWNWSRGEPPESQAAYYQRYNKTFARMGGALRYLSADNRDFLLALWQKLQAMRNNKTRPQAYRL